MSRFHLLPFGPLIVVGLLCWGIQGVENTPESDRARANAPAAPQQTHEGYVLRVESGQLTMMNRQGNRQYTHEVPRDATVTCDGSACELEDLQPGNRVRVTTKADLITVITVAAQSRG